MAVCLASIVLVLFLLESSLSLQYVQHQYYLGQGCIDSEYLNTYEISSCHPAINNDYWEYYECASGNVIKNTCTDSDCNSCNTQNLGVQGQCSNVNNTLSQILSCVPSAPEILPSGTSGQYYYADTASCDSTQTPIFVSEFINDICITMGNGSIYYDCGSGENQFISIYTCFHSDCTQCDEATQVIGCHTATTTQNTVAYATVCGGCSVMSPAAWILVVSLITVAIFSGI